MSERAASTSATPKGSVAVRAEGVSKLYSLGEQRGLSYGLLSERIGNLFRAPLRRTRTTAPESRPDAGTLWALHDVSFELRRGEALGLVGRNGAGKSTLLKILSRITPPTEGRLAVYGRVATLLEVGTGFHPELTGRENVYLNGTILGMRRREIDRKFDEIVEFSGVEAFLDTPVKRYSSGMYVRLAFAVAAHLEPEILLVDEVLAVGDQQFQNKCLGKMQDVADEGRAVVFVSHNLNAVQRLCDRALLIDGGRLVSEGSPSEVVDEYLQRIEPEQVGGVAIIPEEGMYRGGSGEVRLKRVTMSDAGGEVIRAVHLGQRFRVAMEFEVSEPIEVAFEVGIAAADGERVASALSVDGNRPGYALSPGPVEICADLDITLLPHDYVLDVIVRKTTGGPAVDYVARALKFTALNMDESGSDHYRWIVRGHVRPPSEWSVRDPAETAVPAEAR